MKNNQIYCVIGRTASGKSTIVKTVAEELGMKILKSYTTRSMRPGETEETADHTFIKPEEEALYEGEMVAWTQRAGYVNFATVTQLIDSDFYVINPSGYQELCDKVEEMGLRIDLIPIYIWVKVSNIEQRARERDTYEEWYANFAQEDAEFTEFEQKVIHEDAAFIVDNTSSLEQAIQDMKEIIKLCQEDE